MAIYINTLNGGDITITTGGSAPAYHADTWYKYDGDTEWRTVSITGEIYDIFIPNVLNIVALEIGSDVTSIGERAFSDCSGLTSVTIPDSVTSIEGDAFYNCSGLTSVTFLGKTLEQVQNIEDGNGNKQYPWGISDTSIITVS